MQDISIIGIIVAVVVLVILLFMAIGYVKAPPDMAYIISGVKKKSKVVIGKASIRIPFFERLDKLNLRLIPIDVKTSNAVPTADYININVDATVNVKISNNPENPPTTLDEIADACEKLTVTENGQVTRYGFNAVLDRYEMVNLVGNQGEGTYFGDNESGRSGLITKLTCEEQIGNIFK